MGLTAGQTAQHSGTEGSPDAPQTKLAQVPHPRARQPSAALACLIRELCVSPPRCISVRGRAPAALGPCTGHNGGAARMLGAWHAGAEGGFLVPALRGASAWRTVAAGCAQ